MFIGDGGIMDGVMNSTVVMKSVVLTSGTSWSIPANLLHDTVWVSGIAGGEGAISFGAPDGDAGSTITKQPYDVSGGTVTYAIGAGGLANGGNGSNTTFGTITLLGGGATGHWGSEGAYTTTGYNANLVGIWGQHSGSSKTGNGIGFNGTQYGQGGAGANPGADGVLFLEWMESV